MKNNIRKEILRSIKMIIIAVVLGVGTSYLFAYTTWTPPTATAPADNVDAPINVTATLQTKAGALVVNNVNNNGTEGSIVPNGFTAFGQSIFQAFNPNGVTGVPVAATIGSTEYPSTIQIVDGNQAVGAVLTSDASGTASWQIPAIASELGLVNFIHPIATLQAAQGKTWTVYYKYNGLSPCDANPDPSGAYKGYGNLRAGDDSATCPHVTSASTLIAGTPNVTIGTMPATYSDETASIDMRADMVTLGELCSVLFPSSPWPSSSPGTQYYNSGGHDYIFWDKNVGVWFEVTMGGSDGIAVMQGNTEQCTTLHNSTAAHTS